jgi:hypothetical protein
MPPCPGRCHCQPFWRWLGCRRIRLLHGRVQMLLSGLIFALGEVPKQRTRWLTKRWQRASCFLQKWQRLRWFSRVHRVLPHPLNAAQMQNHRDGSNCGRQIGQRSSPRLKRKLIPLFRTAACQAGAPLCLEGGDKTVLERKECRAPDLPDRRHAEERRSCEKAGPT